MDEIQEDWVSRLEVELKELKVRFDRLDAFIGSDKFPRLPSVDRQSLSNQHYHMEGYKSQLERRLYRHRQREALVTRAQPTTEEQKELVRQAQQRRWAEQSLRHKEVDA
jgi:hypothetical protein